MLEGLDKIHGVQIPSTLDPGVDLLSGFAVTPPEIAMVVEKHRQAAPTKDLRILIRYHADGRRRPMGHDHGRRPAGRGGREKQSTTECGPLRRELHLGLADHRSPPVTHRCMTITARSPEMQVSGFLRATATTRGKGSHTSPRHV